MLSYKVSNNRTSLKQSKNWTVIFSLVKHDLLDADSHEYKKFTMEAAQRNLKVMILHPVEVKKILEQTGRNQEKIFQTQLLQYSEYSDKAKVFIFDRDKKVRAILSYSHLEAKVLEDVLPIFDAIKVYERPLKGITINTLLSC